MKSFSVLLFILFLFCLVECQNAPANKIRDIPCGDFTCTYNQGICVQSTINSTCICIIHLQSYPSNNTIQCDYPRKKQLTAFLLELFLTYGAGHFYTGNIQFAVPKLFFWVVSYCLFIVLRIVSKSNEDNNTTSLIIMLLACMFCVGMLTWQIADVVLYGLNKYSDGNGIELQPWS